MSGEISIGTAGNVAPIAKVGIEKVGGKVKVVAASLWDWRHGNGRDFPTILGMLDEVFDDENEIREAVAQILSDLNLDYSVVQVDIYYVD